MSPNLCSIRVVKNLLKSRDFEPSKRLGQNFLVSQRVLAQIIEAAQIKPSEETILEIGPGFGTLTREIAKRAKQVIAVEKDRKLAEILKETTKTLKNVKIIQNDILKVPDSKFRILNSYKVAANLPYYIVSPVIRKFLEMDFPPKEMVLMVQKEVAQRICSEPPKMNLLAVSVQFYSKPEIISYVKKSCFWPKPKVDSAILRIKPLISADKKPADIDLFFKLVKAGFPQPRKQLLNNLSKSLKSDKKQVKSWLLKNKIQPSQRAQTLRVDEWKRLTQNFPFL